MLSALKQLSISLPLTKDMNQLLNHLAMKIYSALILKFQGMGTKNNIVFIVGHPA
jgi:hypothetical protein